MASKAKKQVPKDNAVAKLDEPIQRSNLEELITVTRHQMDAIKASTEYAGAPSVQTAVTVLTASTDAFDKTVSSINEKKAELATLFGVRETQHTSVLRDRASLRSVITTAAQGSPQVIKAFNCIVRTTATPAPTADPPEHLTLKISKTTPGAIEAKCARIKGAGSYVFAVTTDPNAAVGTGQLVTVTKCKTEIPGQPLGHLIYVRVAVVRKGGEQSRWSEPAQILVR